MLILYLFCITSCPHYMGQQETCWKTLLQLSQTHSCLHGTAILAWENEGLGPLVSPVGGAGGGEEVNGRG